MTTFPSIPLDTERGPSTPVLKRKRIGEEFVGMVVEQKLRDHRTMAGVVVMKADGVTPKQEQMLTVVTISSTMVVGLGQEEHTATPGEVVRIIFASGGLSTWIDTKDAFKRSAGRGLNVGDVVTLSHTYAEVYAGAGSKPTNVATQEEADRYRAQGRQIGYRGPVVVRQPTAAEGAAWAEQVFAARAATVAAPAISVDVYDDAPF